MHLVTTAKGQNYPQLTPSVSRFDEEGVVASHFSLHIGETGWRIGDFQLFLLFGSSGKGSILDGGVHALVRIFQASLQVTRPLKLLREEWRYDEFDSAHTYYGRSIIINPPLHSMCRQWKHYLQDYPIWSTIRLMLTCFFLSLGLILMSPFATSRFASSFRCSAVFSVSERDHSGSKLL